MNKKILAVVTGLTLAANVGFAAPLGSLAAGETAVGYNHYGMSHSTDNNSYSLQSALTDKWTLGVERNNYSGPAGQSWNATDISAQYRLDQNVSLIVGSRDYDYADSKMFLGVGVNKNLAPRLDGYASVISSSFTTEWQAGLNYAATDRVSINLSYKNNKDDRYPTYDGVGVGLSYKF